MENLKIYNLIKESIDSVFFIDNFYYTKIEYENLFSNSSLSLSNFKKNNLIKIIQESKVVALKRNIDFLKLVKY